MIICFKFSLVPPEPWLVPLCPPVPSLHLQLNPHLRKRQPGDRHRRPDRPVPRNPLPQLRSDVVVRVIHPNVVRPNGVDVLPAPEPRRLQDAVDVVEGEVYLPADIVRVDLAADRPAALAGALDRVAKDDGLRVMADVAELLAGASVVVVLQGGHGWAKASRTQAGRGLESNV